MLSRALKCEGPGMKAATEDKQDSYVLGGETDRQD